MPKLSAQDLPWYVHPDQRRPKLNFSVPLVSGLAEMAGIHAAWLATSGPDSSFRLPASEEPPESEGPAELRGGCIVFPLSGVLACQIMDDRTEVWVGSLVHVPSGQSLDFRCLMGATYGVIELGLGLSKVSLQRQPRLFTGIRLGDFRPWSPRAIQPETFLKAGQVPGVNVARHRLMAGPSRFVQDGVNSFVLLVCLAGKLRVRCTRNYRVSEKELKAGDRLALGPDTRFTVLNITPGGRTGELLQFNLPARPLTR